MTHINPTNESAPSFGTPTPKGSHHQKTDVFETALGKALDRTEAPEMESTSPHALGEITAKGLNILTSSDVVSGKTGKLLELLDSYASQLENPTISLKRIAPVLEKIKDDAGTLLKETERLTDADTNLKKIAARTIVTAQTEYVKFQRGDYLS
ncbi:hypothetical protein [Desulfobacula sp.]|uniref:hypothetical protein n=1 Tax=Desulfobacula sp. TaxID=2593537 RepID=UPI002629D47A|nr:hypothetical protein [Desulfobacula sp.]